MSLVGDINFVLDVLLDISIPESDEGCEKAVVAMMMMEEMEEEIGLGSGVVACGRC
jgi:hypothetical protein